jgi:hypothetical protein
MATLPNPFADGRHTEKWHELTLTGFHGQHFTSLPTGENQARRAGKLPSRVDEVRAMFFLADGLRRLQNRGAGRTSCRPGL